MRSISRPILLLAAGLGLSGCDMTYPTSYSGAGGGNASLVAGFDSDLNVNSSLVEASAAPPNYLIPLPGTANISGATLSQFFPGSNGAGGCVSVYGSVVDPGNGSYPSALLQILLHAGGNTPYDAKFFTGVQFYFRTSPDDNAGVRSFSIPLTTTEPSPRGTCVNPGCYDHFGVNLTSTSGNWQLVSNNFTSLARAGWGSAITPTSMTGENLEKFVMLQWQEGNNNVAGTITVDFQVDEIRFF